MKFDLTQITQIINFTHLAVCFVFILLLIFSATKIKNTQDSLKFLTIGGMFTCLFFPEYVNTQSYVIFITLIIFLKYVRLMNKIVRKF
jgi:hypothetical protein